VSKTLTRLFLSVYLPTLLLSFCSGLLVPILPLFAESFGVSFSLIGLILAAEAIGTLLMDLPAGSLLRYFDRKQVMVLGVSLTVVSVLALVWTAAIWQVFVCRLLAGVGGALWNISRHAYLAEVTLSSERGRAIALFGGINRIGSFAGPVVGGVLAAQFGLRMPFLIYAALAAVTVALAAIFVEKGEERLAVLNPRNHLFDILKTQHQMLLSAGTAQLLGQMIRTARNALVPLYGSSVLGLGVESVGLIMSLASFVDMAMFYPAGYLMDRFGRKFAIIPCFIIQALGMLLIPVASSFSLLLLASIVIGFGNGLGSGTMMTLGADLAPQGSLGEFLGLWRLIGDVGFTAAPIIIGVVADALALAPSALVMSTVGFASAAIFAYGVPETLQRKENVS
jgi:MFS family permease